MNYSKEELDSMPVPEGKVVFLGSNPSCSSPYHDPFSHCKSANKMLNEWIPALGLTRDQVHFMNVANYKTPNNRPLTRSQVYAELTRLASLLENQVVVTLGKTAQFAMDCIERVHTEVSVTNVFTDATIPSRPKYVINMPHPSGRNRQLNDRDFVKRLLASNREIISKLLTPQGVT